MNKEQEMLFNEIKQEETLVENSADNIEKPNIITSNFEIQNNNNQQNNSEELNPAMQEIIKSQIQTLLQEQQKQHQDELNKIREEFEEKLKKQQPSIDDDVIKEKVIETQKKIQEDVELKNFQESNKNLRSNILSEIVSGNRKSVSDVEVSNIAKMEAWNAMRNFALDNDRAKVINEIATQLLVPFKDLFSNIVVLANKQIQVQQDINTEQQNNVSNQNGNNQNSNNSNKPLSMLEMMRKKEEEQMLKK